MTKIKRIESTLESRCVGSFTNLGWDVARENKSEEEEFKPDLTLMYNGRIYGYVELVLNVDIDVIKRKNEKIKAFLERNKPSLFILTNGESFDVFYDGKYATTQSVPPSPEVIGTMRRLLAYYEKFREAMNRDE